MELWDLKNNIINKTIPKLIIMTGEEIGLIRAYVDEISRSLNVEPAYADSVIQAVNNSKMKSLVSKKDKLVIIRDDKAFSQDPNLWHHLKRLSIHIVLIYTSIDKRSKFYKTFKPYIVYFDKMDTSILKQVLKSKINLSDKALDWLIEATNGDYSRCLLEIDKLLLFEEQDHTDLFREFVKEGVIYADIPDIVFDFANALLNRNVTQTFALAEILKLGVDHILQILTILYNNFRNVLSVQLSNKPTESSTGLKEKQIRAIQYRVGKYSDYELIQIVKFLGEFDLDLKREGFDYDIALDYIISKVL